MHYADGRVFTGEYLQGTMLHGEMLYGDGSIYMGSWQNGKEHGHGLYYDSAAGSKYNGEFCAGFYHGVGTITWSDGSCYQGNWCEGHMQGWSTMIRPDGYLVHNGTWSQSEPILPSSYGSGEQVVATASSSAIPQQLDTTASPSLISDTVIEQAKKADLCFDDEMEDVDRWTAELDKAAERVEEEEERLKIETEEAAHFEEDNTKVDEALQALECFAKEEKRNAEEAQQAMEQFFSSNKTDDTMEAIEDEDSFCKMLADKLPVRECFALEEKHKAEEAQQDMEQFLSSNKTEGTTSNEEGTRFEGDNKKAEAVLQDLECFAKEEERKGEEAQQAMAQFLSSNKTEDTTSNDDGNIIQPESSPTTDKNQLLPPILNLVTGELLSTVMCSQFLLPEDIASLLQIDEIFDSHEQLRSSYCSLHGTKFDDTYEDTVERRYGNYQNDTSPTPNYDDDGNYCGIINKNDDGGNDDVSFLIHALEQQKFILADPTSVSSVFTTTMNDDDKPSIETSQKPPSLSPDCLDCRMARFFSKKKCPCCDIFLHHNLFDESPACEGKCKKLICEDCGGNSCDEIDCDDTGIQCDKCFDGFYCECCDGEFHNKCVQSDKCTECEIIYCRRCVDIGFR